MRQRAWKDRRARKKFLSDNALTASGSPRSFYRKTAEEIQHAEASLRGMARSNGAWIRVDLIRV